MALITDQVKFNPKATSSAPSGVAGAVYYDSDINQLMSYDTAYSGVDDNVETDLVSFSLNDNDTLLICSDGLHGQLKDNEKDGNIAWCGCKISGNAPFCDGSHNKL